MKYGLIVYKDTENLGDDVQSYAAEQFLPQVDYIIDRESIDSFIPEKKEFVATIMNAWWLNKKYNWPPSPYIYPHLTSMHFTHWDTIYHMDFKHLSEYGLDYLKKFAPVGCRDESTLNLLQTLNIDAYLSCCMTLTINKLKNVSKGNYILLVDTNEKITNKVKEISNKKIISITNKLNSKEYSSLNWTTRKKEVEKYLKLIQGASLVITPRLHCALPSLALETPVLLIDYNLNLDRTGTFLNYLYHTSEADFINNIYDYDINAPKENKKDYLIVRDNLIMSCTNFIKNTIETNIELDSLPDIEIYKDFMKRSNFQKKLLLDSYDKLNKLYQDEVKKNQEVWLSRNKLQQEFDELYKKYYQN